MVMLSATVDTTAVACRPSAHLPAAACGCVRQRAAGVAAIVVVPVEQNRMPFDMG